jgi:hypothetical protein
LRVHCYCLHKRRVTNATPLSSNGKLFAERRAADDRARLVTLMERTGQGDASAFEELYRRTSAKLFGMCCRIFPDRGEAEDALQDAYITVWNKAATFDAARASPITWLATVTRNRAIDRLRARGRTGLAPIEEANEIADAAPLADAQLVSRDTNQALALIRCAPATRPLSGPPLCAAQHMPILRRVKHFRSVQ